MVGRVRGAPNNSMQRTALRAAADAERSTFSSSVIPGSPVLSLASARRRAPLTVVHSGLLVEVALAWVIVRDGPGTWARNADWDEYIIVVRNLRAVPLEVTSVTLHDALGDRVSPESDRRALVRASRQAVRRYRDADLKVKAGVGGAVLVATGAVLWYGVAAPIAVVAAGGTALGVATGAVIAAPILVVGGLMRAANHRKVNDEIVRRHTTFPVTLAPGEERMLSVFFPLTPSPSRIDIELGEDIITIDTAGILIGLHLPD